MDEDSAAVKAAHLAAVVPPTRGSPLEILRARPTIPLQVRTNDERLADQVPNERPGHLVAGCETPLRGPSLRLELDEGKGSPWRVKDEA